MTSASMMKRPSASGLAGSWQGSGPNIHVPRMAAGYSAAAGMLAAGRDGAVACEAVVVPHARSEEHTSELQSLMRISYSVFCLNTKKQTVRIVQYQTTTQNE